MQYVVRLAIPEDLVHLPEIERSAAVLFPEEDLPAHLHGDVTPLEELAQAQAAGLLWVAATEDATPVGSAYLVPMDQHIHLEELSVHPEHGRRGLGKMLVSSVVEWARERGYSEMTLTTFGHLPWNAPFYERMGFVRLEEADLSESLREELDWEAAHGLERSKRVAMRLEL